MSAFLVAAAEAETRTLKLYNNHTKERVSITFKKNGRYLPEGLREANRFLRDWRRNEITKMDPELLDLVWEVYQQVGARDAIHVVSSYRSPATNNMLRSRSSGVAKNSQHTLGKAMDFFIPGVNLSTLRATGLRKHVGGVGYYPRSGSPFVHMDTGTVRHWPRMTRSQLAQVFPDGKTLHIPTDGKPLSGYKVALAEAQSGKLGKVGGSTRPTIVASNDRPARTNQQSLTKPGDTIPIASQNRSSSGGGGNLFASLFGGGGNKNDTTDRRPGAVAATAPAAQPSESALVIDNPPVPTRKIQDDEPETAEEEVPADAPAEAPVVVAMAAPLAKPTLAAPVADTPPPAPGTLDAQRVALENGQPALESEALDSRFQVARAPAHKPAQNLSEAAQVAARSLGLSDEAAPVPEPTPTDDPVAAIAAATGAGVPSPAPAPRPETTLAYASATATPPSLTRSLQPAATGQQARANARPAGNAVQNSESASERSVSGRIPREQIVDPLAGFASLPDKSEPSLLSGAGTTRHQSFAWLSHPNQRQLKNVMIPGNRFVAASFEQTSMSGLRTDRFDDGPAVVVLPVRFAR